MPSSGGSDKSGQVCHTTLLPHQGGAGLSSYFKFHRNHLHTGICHLRLISLKYWVNILALADLPLQGAWEPEWYHVTGIWISLSFIMDFRQVDIETYSALKTRNYMASTSQCWSSEAPVWSSWGDHSHASAFLWACTHKELVSDLDCPSAWPAGIT